MASMNREVPTEIIEFPVAAIEPHQSAILQHLGYQADGAPVASVAELINAAHDLLRDLADPVGVMKQISVTDFKSVFKGQGLNDPQAPLARIYPAARELFLFCLTLGKPVSARIERLFTRNDSPLGFILDGYASLATENAVDLLEREIGKDSGLAALSYSPGYCGWHISAQNNIFKYLLPEQIGVTINSEFLMEPLKSVSGVIVAGVASIHIFKPRFTFCRDCSGHSCHARLRAIKNEA